MRSNTGPIVVGLVALALLGGAFVFLRSMGSTGPTPAPSPTSTVAASPEGTGSDLPVKEITVSGNEFTFTPNAIDLKTGETVKVTFKNVGKLPHNFVIDQLNVMSKIIQPGESDTVEFTVQEGGSFQFYCSVGNHQSLGMHGDLEVK